MSDDWNDLVRKAIFCQGEGNMRQAMALWQRAEKLTPLDHLGRLNYLLCRRALNPQQDNMLESLDLAKGAVMVPYFDMCLVIAMLCCHESGVPALAANLAVMLAERVLEAEREGRANVWDLAGEPSLVNEEGGAVEAKSGANIIRCLEAILIAIPRGSHGEEPIGELLKRYQAREHAMNTSELAPIPPRKVWWKFW